MDFFNTVFSDDLQPSDSQNTPTSSPKSPSSPLNPNPNSKPSISTITNAWSFGGFIKTLASKSESAFETYRRDLEEFSSGLKIETAVIREAATRAVTNLPSSLEAGAAVAQESLESVGQAIDNIGNTVSEIISQGKESILDDYDDDMPDGSKQISFNSRPYSRIDAQIRSMQSDLNTYCKEIEELDEYNEWKLGFKLGEMGGEIEGLIEENGLIEEIYNEVVPRVVDEETFWSRYFYRVYKVKRAEEVRAKFVKRAISGGDDEEDLSWDVDDDDYQQGEGGSKSKNDSIGQVEDKYLKVETEEKSLRSESDDKELASELKRDSVVDERVNLDESESSGNKLEAKYEEKSSGSEGGKPENGGSCKDSDFSIVSSQPSMPDEEDLGWDEIEDIGDADEIKVTASGSPNRIDLRKRLSAMEEEEDLGWDIEDDDDKPVKS